MIKNRVVRVTADEKRKIRYATVKRLKSIHPRSLRNEALAFDPGPRAVCQNFWGFCLVVVLC
ncbi:MAG: hypothetical protein F4X77_17365 [Acidobacteriia bacterium]|nr:hypothetical protein [Terriglobia bacterium]MYC65127.1 hypothetical protein [Terriglobia bacterium]